MLAFHAGPGAEQEPDSPNWRVQGPGSQIRFEDILRDIERGWAPDGENGNDSGAGPWLHGRSGFR